MLDVGDPITLSDGYLQDGRYGARRTMRFALEGLLEQAGRMKQVVTQTATPSMSTDDAVLGLIRDAYGLTSLPDVRLTPTPLTIFSLDGAAARYVSQFSQVAGAFPMVDGSGGLRLYSPTDPPANVQAFSSSEYAVTKATSEFDINQLWNRALIVTLGTTTLSGLSTFSGSNQIWSNSEIPPGETRAFSRSINLPPPGDGQTYQSPNVQVSRYLQVLTEFRSEDLPPFFSATWVTRPQWSISNVAISNNVLTFDVIADSDFTWQRGTGQSVVPTINHGFRAGGLWAGVVLEVQYSYARIENERTLEVVNEESIGLYRERTLDFLPLFGEGAETVIQERIDDLSIPRSWHNVDFALIQDTDERTRNVALLNAGDYIELDVHDQRTQTHPCLLYTSPSPRDS